MTENVQDLMLWLFPLQKDCKVEKQEALLSDWPLYLWLKHTLTTECQTEDVTHTFTFLSLRCNKHTAEQLIKKNIIMCDM